MSSALLDSRWAPSRHRTSVNDKTSNMLGRPAPLISPEELAVYLGVPKATIYKWRYEGIGPKAYRIGRHLRYRAADVEAFIEANVAED